MKEQLEAIRKGALESIAGTQAAADLEALRVKYLGKKGELTAVYVGLGLTRNTWGTVWWVFAVGGILCGVVSVALNPYKGED